MGVIKTVTKSEGVRRMLCWLGAQYIRLVFASGRWTVEGGAGPDAFWREGRPFILAFWHGRILMMPYCWRRDKAIHMLISQHRDGRLIAETVGHFGIATVTGSSSKGGSQALRAMLKSLKSGECVGITPDGPRGPRMRASEGIVQVARLSGCPIIPCSFATEKGRTLGSWDRFLVAFPLSRGVFVWGEPIEVPHGASAPDLEAARQKVEDSLNAITRRADMLCGRDPVTPADETVAGATVP
ncbi:MAG: lysophospholipid acyltransferase family protein [Telmatospirillum sp.]|nr:lysophospholipid acyltransferase family protein [Telmatospirillum sp.]